MRSNHVPRALLVSVCVAAWITACGAEDAVDRAADCESCASGVFECTDECLGVVP
jgi:hypothetical protein